VISAFAQLRAYRDSVRTGIRRGELEDNAPFRFCNPSLIVIAGRSGSFAYPEEKEILLEQFTHVQLYTYDEVAEIVRRNRFPVYT
jgi:hypothetical protein